MGKKTRREREEKRDSYATQHNKQQRKNILIAAGVFAIVGVIVGVSAYNFVVMPANVLGGPPGAGTFGDEHEHASILTVIHGDRFDFSGSAYQTKNSWIHFESQDGTTIHRHSSGVTMGYLFDSLAITVDEECYVFPSGREFCSNDEFELKYYVNRVQVPDIYEHVLDDEDDILIIFGDESDAEIDTYLDEVGAQAIMA